MAAESSYNQFSAHMNPSMQGFEYKLDLYGGHEMLGFSNKHISTGDLVDGEEFNRFVSDDYSPIRSLFPAESIQQRQALLLFSTKHCDAPTIQSAHSVHDDHYAPRHSVQLMKSNSYPQHNFFVNRSLLLTNSKYLGPAQQLLNEFCSLRSDEEIYKKRSKIEELGKTSSSSSSMNHHQSLRSMDVLQLQEIRAKLLAMVEEVDRRYRSYSMQMKTLVESFEAVAGERAATVYSKLASKAMSRHFRCLRDGIVRQLREVKNAIEEKVVKNGTTSGETPRLKLLDECIRQQKAFSQRMMIEQHPWRPQRGLPERAVSVLRSWLFEHFLHPYPTDVDKHVLARQSGLSRSQVSNWFINARVRLWKPMVEEMYMEEVKQDSNEENPNSHTTNPNPNPNNNSNNILYDHKPLQVQLLNPHDNSESLSCIINTNPTSSFPQHNSHQNAFVVGDHHLLDFEHRNNAKLRSGVSLTLGLQQHNSGGMSLSFTSNVVDDGQQSHSLFTRDEDLGGDINGQHSINFGPHQSQNLHYRNLMGSHILHDMAG